MVIAQWTLLPVLVCVANLASGGVPGYHGHWGPPQRDNDQAGIRSGQSDQHILNNYALGQRFETVQQENAYLRFLYDSHSDKFDETVDTFLNEATRNEQAPRGHGSQECANVTQQTADLQQIWTSWKTGSQHENDDCSQCTFLIGLLRTLVCRVEFQRAVDFSIRLCEVVLEQVNQRHGICNGTITLQAPYVFTAIKESMPYDVCESLNRCIPPPEQPMTVPERIARILTSARAPPQKRQSRRLTARENALKIVHLADVHINPRYAIGSAIDCNMYICCLAEYNGTGEARMYGEHQCNIPERTLHHFLEKVEEIDPDLIIFTGDAPPHIIWEQTFESQLNCTEILVGALKNKFSDKGIYPSVGNHENYPTNVYARRSNYTKMMNEESNELWKDLAGFGPEQEATMRHLAYYNVMAKNHPGLRIVSLNSMHYAYNKNFMCTLNRNTTDEAVYRQYIIDSLASARANGERVILISHQPPGGSDNIVRVSRWFESLVLEYSDVILIHISGHTHKDEFHLFLDPDTSEAKAINVVSTSVTANSNVNPSLKIFYLNGTTYDIDDIETYYMELDDQRPNLPPPIVPLYNARELYGLEDFTPASWKDFSIRLLEDEALFKTWFDNKAAMSMLSSCTGSCHLREICRMWFPNYDEVEACVDYMTSPPPTPIVTTSTIDGAVSVRLSWTVYIAAMTIMVPIAGFLHR